MRFELPAVLALAPVVALAFALGAWFALRRRTRLGAAWSPALGRLARRGGTVSVPLLAAAALFAAFGVAGPRGGRVARDAAGSGLNVMLAVDISRSMLAEDVAPNRLQRAIAEARRLVQDLPADRIGVIGFAGQSHLLAPLTLDRGAVSLYLETLDPDMVTAQGTRLEAVLRQGAQVLEASIEGGDRVLVVFTDGEGHDSVAAQVAAARELGRAGVRLILVAQGSDRPARIPVRAPSGERTGYHRDAEGQVVETLRRDDALRWLAEAAGGLVIPAETPDQAGAIRDDLRALERRPVRERRLADLTPLAWIAALAATLVLLAHTAMRRGAALAGLGLVVLTPTGDAQRQQFPAERGDTAWYNAGSTALAAGRLEEAREALARAARTLDPGLRYRALYNLGVGALTAARTDTAVRDARAAEAVRRFKEALLIEPGAEDAKWNLELALRYQPPPGAARPPPPPPGAEAAEPPPSPTGGLSPTEAEAILQAVERDEATTRVNAMQRQRPRTAAALRDW